MNLKISSYPAPRTDGFAFSPDNLAKAKDYMARYPEGRQASAVIYLLYLAQVQNDNWVSDACIEAVAELLEMAPIRVYEVASFYTMFNRKPVGKYLVQVCRTTHCWLNGSDAIAKACLDAAGTTRLGETSGDGMVTVSEVECLGACCNAPLFQVNDRDYYEDLTPERAKEIVTSLRRDEAVMPGSQKGRLASVPEGGPTTLKATFGKEGG